MLEIIIKILLTKIRGQEKSMEESSFNGVGRHLKLSKHANYIFSAKQWQKKFKSSDDVCFGGSR